MLLFMTALLQKYGQPLANHVPACLQEVERVCDYMHQHVDQRITLDQLCRCAEVSKSTLLRAAYRRERKHVQHGCTAGEMCHGH